MFELLRWLLSVGVFRACLVYASLSSLRVALADIPGEEDEDGEEVLPRAAALNALKLWLMLATFACLSDTTIDRIPLFLEFRSIFCVLLILLESRSRGLVYDRMFAPFLDWVASWVLLLQRHKVRSRLALLGVRGCVTTAIRLTNLAQESSMLDPAAAQDVVGGLAFTLRALEDVNTIMAPFASPVVGTSDYSDTPHKKRRKRRTKHSMVAGGNEEVPPISTAAYAAPVAPQLRSVRRASDASLGGKSNPGRPRRETAQIDAWNLAQVDPAFYTESAESAFTGAAGAAYLRRGLGGLPGGPSGGAPALTARSPHCTGYGVFPSGGTVAYDEFGGEHWRSGDVQSVRRRRSRKLDDD